MANDKINIAVSLTEFKQLLIIAQDNPTLEPLNSIMKRKLQKLINHELYTKSKTAATAEERELARQRYLDEIGVPKNFRW